MPVAVVVMAVTVALAVAFTVVDDAAVGRIEDQDPRRVLPVEVEHARNRARSAVERGLAGRRLMLPVDEAQIPVLLDEAHGGGLVGQGVIDMVPLGEGRDHEIGQARSEAATTLEGGRSRGLRAALAVAVEEVELGRRRADGRSELVIVPAVRVVPADDHRGAVPFLGLHQRIDQGHDPGLLRQRIRVAGMAVLVGRHLHEGDFRQHARVDRRVEIVEVVLVVGLVGLPDLVHRAVGQVVRISRRRIVLERHVVRDVVGDRVVQGRDGALERGGRLRDAGMSRMGLAADRDAAVVGGVDGRREAAREPTPGDVLRVEQVADVLAEELRGPAGRAVVEERIDIADEGPLTSRGIIDHNGAGRGHLDRHRGVRDRRRLHDGAVGLARDQIDSAVRRRAVAGVKRVVAHGEVLGVVPERRDGVAVEIGHHGRRRLEGARVAAVRRVGDVERPLGRGLAAGAGVAGVLEHVHGAAVGRALLVAVAVVLGAGKGVRRAQAERLRNHVIRVHILQIFRMQQGVGLRRILLGGEPGLAGLVLGLRIGAEVVIEGCILLENDNDVLDGSLGGRPVIMIIVIVVGERRHSGCDNGERRGHTAENDRMPHKPSPDVCWETWNA